MLCCSAVVFLYSDFVLLLVAFIALNFRERFLFFLVLHAALKALWGDKVALTF